MTTDERILHDLNKHLRAKFARAMDDHIQLCRAADLGFNEVCAELMQTLSAITASFAAFNSEMDERDFVRIMQLQFRIARKEEAREAES